MARARWLFDGEDAAGLVACRVLVGGILAWDLARFIVAGWVDEHFLEPVLLLKYYGFEWVHPLPPVLHHSVFYLGVAAGVGIAVGAAYRLCAMVFFLAHAYVFLLASSYYLNHAYLICLLTFGLLFLPLHRAGSVDAWRRPALATATMPRWVRASLRAQVGIVYVFGGVAKINEDWLVHYMPLRRWLANAASSAPVGADIVGAPWFTGLVAWGGLSFDLLVFPALLWRRTRPIAVILTTGFHLTNAYLFNIGVFPWLMLALTTLFFEPDWPRRLPFVGPRLGALLDRGRGATPPDPARRRLITTALAVWFVIQCALPLRHHLYPGNVAWTEEGHLYSWRMKLRSKRGKISFRVRDPDTGEVRTIDPALDLSDRQVRKMGGRPELVLQYAKYLAAHHRSASGASAEVYVDAWVSLNYRRRQRLIDPTVDLAAEPMRLGPYPFILPLAPTPPPTEDPAP